MTVIHDVEYAQSGFMKINIAGHVDVAAHLGSVLNPEGQDLHIIEGYLVFETPADAAATYNIGIGTEEEDKDDLMSDMAMNQTAKTVWQVVDKDTASESELTSPGGVDWGEDEYLTITTAAYLSTKLRACLLLKYLRLDDLAQ